MSCDVREMEISSCRCRKNLGHIHPPFGVFCFRCISRTRVASVFGRCCFAIIGKTPTLPSLLQCFASRIEPVYPFNLLLLACCHQGILNFPCSSCYVSLKALAVGTLCKLCRTEPDVATLAMHLSLAPALLQAVYDDTSTVYLKVSFSVACVLI